MLGSLHSWEAIVRVPRCDAVLDRRLDPHQLTGAADTAGVVAGGGADGDAGVGVASAVGSVAGTGSAVGIGIGIGAAGAGADAGAGVVLFPICFESSILVSQR